MATENRPPTGKLSQRNGSFRRVPLSNNTRCTKEFSTSQNRASSQPSVPTSDGTRQLKNRLTSLVLTDRKSMSIELFAGKSNIFESNQGYQKILSEIHPSPTVPQDTKLIKGQGSPARAKSKRECSAIRVNLPSFSESTKNYSPSDLILRNRRRRDDF
jgi:hypothetical protein